MGLKRRIYRIFLLLCSSAILGLGIDVPAYAAATYGCGAYGQSAYGQCPAASTGSSSGTTKPSSTAPSDTSAVPTDQTTTTEPTASTTPTPSQPTTTQTATEIPAQKSGNHYVLGVVFSILLVFLGLSWFLIVFLKKRHHSSGNS